MHKLILILILSSFLLYAAYAQEPQPKILWDGHEWDKYHGKEGHVIKVIYLIGLYHGQIENSNNIYAALELEFSWKESEIQRLMAYVSLGSTLSLGGVKWNDVIENVDKYYKDNKNKKIPVCSLATFVTRRLMGQLNAEEAAAELLRLRAFYSESRPDRKR
jgi:hypothetical protein